MRIDTWLSFRTSNVATRWLPILPQPQTGIALGHRSKVTRLPYARLYGAIAHPQRIATTKHDGVWKLRTGTAKLWKTATAN